ncbi:MAG TPA: hypothetical protein VH142_11625 [Polyangiaceae bacterium]|jgi:hypothetical protein|nr:hypothetical protein [Polyangiaceae bacterium]
MSETECDRVLERLTTDAGGARRELVTLSVDHVLGRPLRELVDLDALHAIVVEGLTADNVGRFVERHLSPGFRRYAEYVARSDETVGAFVPEPARKKIVALARAAGIPRARWTDGLVDPTLLKKLLAPVWAGVLVNFAKRLPVPGMGGADSGNASAVGRGVNAIAGRIGRSVQERAEKLVDAGRAVMGGLGAEVEKRMNAAAAEFSDGAATLFRDALRVRLESDEGKRIVGELVSHGVAHVMATELRVLHEDVAALPIDDVLSVVPPIVHRGAPREFVQGLVEREIRAFLDVEGARTLRELLDETGSLDRTRAVALERVDSAAQGIFSSPAFADWLTRLLA